MIGGFSKHLMFSALALALSACATDRTGPLFAEGGAKITGRADGCREAMLIPSNVQTDTMIANTFGNTSVGSYRIDFESREEMVRALEKGSKEHQVSSIATRIAPCGPYSEFAFEHVPEGTYYATTAIRHLSTPRARDSDLLAKNYEIGLMKKIDITRDGRNRVRFNDIQVAETD